MKKAILFLMLCSLSFVYSQEQYIKVNTDSISVADFKILYKKNIEVEGIAQAIDNYIEFTLIQQQAKKRRVDTTQYYKSVYKRYISDYFTPVYDSILVSNAKQYNIKIDSLPISQKKELLYQVMTSLGLQNVLSNEKAINEIKEKAGKDFFKNKKQLSIKTNLPVFTTPYDSIYQEEIVFKLNKVKENVPKIDTVDFEKYLDINLFYMKNKFAYDDLNAHLPDYIPSFKKREDLLIRSILANYIIEKDIHQVADLDSIGQQNYINSHKKQFTWPTRYKTEIFRYLNKSDADDILKQLQSGKSGKEIAESYKGKEIDHRPLIIYMQGLLTPDYKDLKDYDPHKKYQWIHFRNSPALVHTIEEVAPSVMTLKEAGKSIKSAYRNFIYQKYIKNLKEKATIYIPKSLK